MLPWARLCFFMIHISAELVVKDISLPLQSLPAGVQLQVSTANPFISSFLSFLSQWITPALLCSQFYTGIFTIFLKTLCTLKIKWEACSGNQTKISLQCSAEAVLTHSDVSVSTHEHATFTYIGYIQHSYQWYYNKNIAFYHLWGDLKIHSESH